MFHILSINQEYFRQRNMLENSQNGDSWSERAMRHFRKIIYEMCLDNNQDTVTEFGRSHSRDWSEMKVNSQLLFSTCNIQQINYPCTRLR